MRRRQSQEYVQRKDNVVWSELFDLFRHGLVEHFISLPSIGNCKPKMYVARWFQALVTLPWENEIEIRLFDMEENTTSLSEVYKLGFEFWILPSGWDCVSEMKFGCYFCLGK
ncbi:uncharacterized protein LOC119988405 [Tripterygium wilfordii]|uniref:uncharacterized protein LOC119988405 n=1 Tax=Tripterygium wilfordii TaxID=458696 RepID=UPI0018F855E9|nr:uncharacterized protein LOC119988405 [Tripterygium wilfordii]